LGQILNHGNRWKKEKGLTLVEMVVSLAIIVIVSVAAISIAVYSSNTQKRVAISRYFTVLIDNSLRLYETYSDTDFEDAFEALTGQAIYYNTNRTYYLNLDYQYVEESNAVYNVRYVFKSNGLVVTAMYSDGDVIYEGSSLK